jgi:hypothetical protein
MTSALRELIRLLARLAVQEYLQEIHKSEQNLSCDERKACSKINQEVR